MNMAFPVSNCCQALLIAVSEDEGTAYYTCGKCGEACDMYVETPTPSPQREQNNLTNAVIVANKISNIVDEYGNGTVAIKELVVLINDLLKDKAQYEHEKLSTKVKEMKKQRQFPLAEKVEDRVYDSDISAYNQAIQDVIAILEQEVEGVK